MIGGSLSYLDGVDSEGETTYQHIYEHSDGRKAYVGPGYCSDPDLEWILFKRNRKKKEWNIRQNKSTKINLYLISIPWVNYPSACSLLYSYKGVWFYLIFWDFCRLKLVVLAFLIISEVLELEVQITN